MHLDSNLAERCSVLACNMVHRIEANPKSSDFQRILSLPAPRNFLNSIPVFHGEHGIIVDIQRRPCNTMSENPFITT